MPPTKSRAVEVSLHKNKKGLERACDRIRALETEATKLSPEARKALRAIETAIKTLHTGFCVSTRRGSQKGPRSMHRRFVPAPRARAK
jgi:hypothetical protein